MQKLTDSRKLGPDALLNNGTLVEFKNGKNLDAGKVADQLKDNLIRMGDDFPKPDNNKFQVVMGGNPSSSDVEKFVSRLKSDNEFVSLLKENNISLEVNIPEVSSGSGLLSKSDFDPENFMGFEDLEIIDNVVNTIN